MRGFKRCVMVLRLSISESIMLRTDDECRRDEKTDIGTGDEETGGKRALVGGEPFGRGLNGGRKFPDSPRPSIKRAMQNPATEKTKAWLMEESAQMVMATA